MSKGVVELRYAVGCLLAVSSVFVGTSVSAQEAPAASKVLAESMSWTVSTDGEFCTISSLPERGRFFHYRTDKEYGYHVGLTTPTIVLEDSNRFKVMLRVDDRVVPVVQLFTLFGVIGDASHFEFVDGRGNVERFETAGLAEVKPQFARCMNRLKGLITRGPVPKLISFDGGAELVRTASSLGMLRQRLGFALAVSAMGEITDCRLSQSFRRAIVKKSLCEVLTKHHKFEPAVNAAGNPVRGVYDGELLMYSVLG